MHLEFIQLSSVAIHSHPRIAYTPTLQIKAHAIPESNEVNRVSHAMPNPLELHVKATP